MMNTDAKPKGAVAVTTDLLLLADGRVLVHHLTPPMAEVLKQLNPQDDQIQPRASYEFTHLSRRSQTEADHERRITHHDT